MQRRGTRRLSPRRPPQRCVAREQAALHSWIGACQSHDDLQSIRESAPKRLLQVGSLPVVTEAELASGAAPFMLADEGARVTLASRENIVLVAVLQHLEEMFDAIRDGMRAYPMTNYIRSSLLQPLAGLSVKLVPQPLSPLVSFA